MKTNLSNIDIGLLNTFIRVAENCNMSETAKELNITQPAVSAAIQKMENSFGVTLFDRSARPMKLTMSGRVVQRRAQAILDDLEHLAREAQDCAKDFRLDLRLGFSDSYGACVSPYLLHRLLPIVNSLSAYTSTTPRIVEKFDADEVDIAVTTRSLDRDERISSTLLFTERFVIATPRKYAGQIRSMADLERLSDELPIIRFNSDTLDSVQVERVLRQCNTRNQRIIAADTNLSVLSFVQNGAGWTVVPPLGIWMARAQAKDVAFHDVTTATRSFYLVHRSPIFEHHAHTIARESIRIIKEAIMPSMVAEMPLVAKCLQLPNLTLSNNRFGAAYTI
jgi:DNA-binding transcriptional LysR family regulator